MKRLLIVILVASFAWFGYWFIGANAAKSGYHAWFAARQADGWYAEVADIAVGGFPNRIDTTFTDVSLADPDTGVSWQMPFFQLLSLSYRPNHLIAVWPHTQTIAFPDQKTTLTSTDMKASVILRGGPSLPLERSNMVISGLSLASSAGWTVAADSLRLAAHHHAEGDNTYRLAITTDALALPFLRDKAARMALPDTLTTGQADILVAFDRPWDRSAIEVARPRPTAINITLAQITWGTLALHAAGKVTLDALGYPTGTITLRAKNWREIIALARDTSTVPGVVLDAVVQGLTLLSGVSGNPKTLDIPLSFRGGMIWLGLVPVAAAPQITLR